MYCLVISYATFIFMSKKVFVFLSEFVKVLNSGNDVFFIKTKHNCNIQSLLSLLKQEGLILEYYYTAGFYKVMLNMSFKNLYKRSALIISSPSKPIHMSYKSYAKICKYRLKSFDIFSTGFGWISGDYVLKNKVGGILVLRIKL